jgi:replication-associated recombination protein RarA
LPRKKIDAAIRSRSFSLEIALSKDDMISRMWSLLNKVEIPSGAIVGGYLREKAMDMIVAASEQDDNVELNMRTLIKAIVIVNKVKNDDTAMRLIRQQCTGVSK